jgi:hypothetical protein
MAFSCSSQALASLADDAYIVPGRATGFSVFHLHSRSGFTGFPEVAPQALSLSTGYQSGSRHHRILLIRDAPSFLEDLGICWKK